MQLKSVLVNVDLGRRVRLYPQGGLDLEAKVNGVGWILDNGAHVNDADLADLLDEAANILRAKVVQLRPARGASPFTTDAPLSDGSGEPLDLLRDLLEWEQQMGGWESPAWERARDFVQGEERWTVADILASEG